MHPLLHLLAGGGPAGYTMTVVGQTVLSSDAGGGAKHCESAVRFNSDGTYDKGVANSGSTTPTYTQLGDWVTPTSAAGDGFWFRATETSYTETETNPSVFGTKNGTMATWLAHTTNPEWLLESDTNSAGEGNIEWIITIDIATDSGGSNIVATESFTLRGNVPG